MPKYFFYIKKIDRERKRQVEKGEKIERIFYQRSTEFEYQFVTGIKMHWDNTMV